MFIAKSGEVVWKKQNTKQLKLQLVELSVTYSVSGTVHEVGVALSYDEYNMYPKWPFEAVLRVPL